MDTDGQGADVTRKALLLFAAASVIWGSSFLFIRIAVEHMPPAAVVFGRTLLGAAFLVPLAASRRAFHGVRPVIVPIIIVTVLDMAAPTFLTAWGEQHVSSSVAGIRLGDHLCDAGRGLVPGCRVARRAAHHRRHWGADPDRPRRLAGHPPTGNP
jgi:EamA-like transporter family